MALSESLQKLAGEYLSSGAITAEVKTNLGPAVTVYSGGGGFSLADALGIKAAIVIRKDGEPIASYGVPPATEPVLVVLLAVTAIAAGVVLFKLVRG